MLMALAGSIVMLRVRHVQFLTVVTGSMAPTIAQGSLVAVSRIQSWPRVGDVISYSSTVNPGEVVTHRVRSIDVANGYLITAGDANRLGDNPIRLQQVVGRVGWQSLFAGKLILVLRRPIGLIAVVYLPALTVIVYELRRLARRQRASRRYQRLA
jgi:signal peptidase I